jgi:predicted MPP superfamily phosphohydrolase
MSECSHKRACDGALVGRVSTLHLQQRLGIERDHEAQVFGQGRTWFHIENWYAAPVLIRTALRLCCLYGRAKRNVLDIAVRQNDIWLPGLPAVFDNFTILHMSDLHLDMRPDIPPALIERVRTLDYNLGVMTGDFRAKTFGPYKLAMDAMARVRDHLKVPLYGILGNHDTIRMVPDLEGMGIRMLLNESIAIERGSATIYLTGIDDPHYYRADNLERACANLPPEAISILLSHSPEIYRHAAHVGFNVMLCGHTHGGQLCLPGGFPIMWNASCPRKLSAGAWQYHQLLGYTSVGVGVSILDVRLNCRPEITLHRLLTA